MISHIFLSMGSKWKYPLRLNHFERKLNIEILLLVTFLFVYYKKGDMNIVISHTFLSMGSKWKYPLWLNHFERKLNIEILLLVTFSSSGCHFTFCLSILFEWLFSFFWSTFVFNVQRHTYLGLGTYPRSHVGWKPF